MKEIPTKCGYRCDLCPAYSVNIKSDEDKVTVSDSWQRFFGFDIPPEEIECVGCHNKGEHADKNCPVRPCVIEKGLENCANCENFGCDALLTRMNFLDEYLINHGREISNEDYQRYVLAYESKPRLMKIREEISLSK